MQPNAAFVREIAQAEIVESALRFIFGPVLSDRLGVNDEHTTRLKSAHLLSRKNEWPPTPVLSVPNLASEGRRVWFRNSARARDGKCVDVCKVDVALI